MTRKPKVKCPGCEQRFYREEHEFTQVKNRYWHKECYDSYIKKEKKKIEDEEALHNYICELFNTSFVSPRIRKQINSYVKNYNFTHSGILGSLKYWFEIKGESVEKANGGIGIVPYIYQQAANYFQTIYAAHQKNQDVPDPISSVRKITIGSPQRNIKSIKTIDLDFLEEDLDE